MKAYFAHHQGMAFVALGNALHGERMRDRFHSDPMVGSSELLLQERVPRAVELVSPHVEEVENVRSVRELPPPGHALVRHRRDARARDALPVQRPLLGDGHQRRRRLLALQRHRHHALPGGPHARLLGDVLLRPRHRQRRGLLGAVQPAPVSARRLPRGLRARQGGVPTAATASWRRTSRSPSRRRTTSRSAGSRSPTAAGRARTSTSRPTSRSRSLPQGADQAHKSFSNLFVETEWLPETGAVLFTRRPRSADEPRLWGLHTVACEAQPCDTSFETDRAAFLGRLRGADDPIALEKPGPLGGSIGPVLDPCCALRRSVVVPAGESVRLVFSTGLAGQPRDRAAPDREVLRRPQRPARHRPRVDRRATRAARPRHQPAGSHHARAPGFSAGADRPVLAAQGEDPGRERAADVRPVVDRDLGRPARSCWCGSRSWSTRRWFARRCSRISTGDTRGSSPTWSSSTRARPATPTTSTTVCACWCAPATRCSCSTSRAASSFAEQTRCTPTS